MHHLFRTIALFSSLIAGATALQADPASLEVTVTYRERIALPPDAQLEVQLIEGAPGTAIASQRFALDGVPRTVSLVHDSRLVAGKEDAFSLVATIWSERRALFRTAERVAAFEGPGVAPVEIVLASVRQDDSPGLPDTIAGVSWSVTEVAGRPWATDDPATLIVDAAGRFSVFGGCNRFNGQMLPRGSARAFPQGFASTLMACPPDIEAQEDAFLDALRSVASHVRYGGGLVMMDANGRALLHFVDRPE